VERPQWKGKFHDRVEGSNAVWSLSFVQSILTLTCFSLQNNRNNHSGEWSRHTDRVWSSAKKDGTGRAFKRVFTPANDGTCRLVETRVKRRTVVKEETTMTTVGKNAVAVAPTTKEEIKDRLHQKYIAAQKINKKDYDDNPPYDCISNEGEEKMLKGLEIFDYPHGGIFAYKHPIDLATNRNLSFTDAFPDLELRSPQGRWVCPLLNEARE
jgi:hypothetical protein